ncbi:hypothetical protein P171DRAFT_191029 [Karstenula rhodostoma CBS 690.94]|uniref:Karyogamy protein 5 n=1 Tax=Karstenula rhodostoma CBS 690.94 TaxID=1392251 RepID=A0A9P4UGA2_9PLEO|nr:hypothetical protein P171DRAFT_191029 [Karstenula rhodostoma CBS 690.94]
MDLLHRLTRIFTVVLAVTILLAAAQSPSLRASHGHAIDPQLSLLMQANAQISQATELKETWAWLEHLSSKPACTQLATSKLTIECQLLDNPSEFATTYPDQVLEDVQNEFALKLAICEFVGAQNHHSKAPHKCHAFLPSHEACVKRSWWGKAEAGTDELCYPKATKSDLQQCLTTMQASPQSWTSYSNARSRAMHICHLTRQHIETERAIQVHKNLTMVVAKMHDSVQPLASKMQSMNDQLQTYSDNFQQSFEKSQQAADEFTTFAKDAHKQHHDQLTETNEGFRNIRSELEASQRQIDEQYATLQHTLAENFKTSLAKNNEVMSQHQVDFLAQFGTTIDDFFQGKARELSEQLKTHKEELQEYHTRNILSLQQQHEATVQSLDILGTELSSANSDVNGLNEKIGCLKNDLDGSIAQIEIVNAGLGSLASMAQTAGRLLGSFETFIILFSIGGIMAGLLLLTKCVSGVPVIGKAAQKLVAIMLALLICSASAYTITRSLSRSFSLDTLVEVLHEARVFEGKLLTIKTTACIALIISAFLFVLRHAFSDTKFPCPMDSIRTRLSRQRSAPQNQLLPMIDPPPNESIPTTPTASSCNATTQSFPSTQLTPPAYTKNLWLSKEAQEDDNLRYRRASTVP